MSFAVEVYDGHEPWLLASLLRTFDEDSERNLRVARSNAGTWTVTVPKGSTDAGFVVTNRWIKFRLDGTVVQAGRIQPWDQQTIAAGEEASEDLTISGPGLLATLNDARVYPHPSTGRLARDVRFFNFASPDYPDVASWSPAIELYQQGDPGTSLPGVDVPENWPDPSAYWIWGTMYDLMASPPQDVGDCYFRTTVTLADEGDYAFFITADDGYELWVDGVLLAAQTEAFIWRQTYRIDQFLDAGTHTVAIKATNIDRPSSPTTNHAGLLFALYSTSSGGELGVLELHSDDTWDCLAYPATPPGFTPGEILTILLDEAQDRGSVEWWTPSFTGSLDSNGDAWDGEITISFRFSDGIYDVLTKMSERWIDFTADPDGIELDVVNRGSLGTAVGVVIQEAVHIEDLRHSNDPAKVTDLLVRDSEGVLTEVSSGLHDPLDRNFPRIEGYLEAGGAGDATNATEQAEGIFDNAGADRVAITAAVVAESGETPFVDFSVGDTVTMPDRDGAGTSTDVEAIIVGDVPPSEDGEEEGSVTYAIEGYQ